MLPPGDRNWQLIYANSCCYHINTNRFFVTVTITLVMVSGCHDNTRQSLVIPLKSLIALNNHNQILLPLVVTTDIERKNRLLKVCYVPDTCAASSKAFLLQPLTVLMRQTRQAVRTINQSIFLRCLCL